MENDIFLTKYLKELYGVGARRIWVSSVPPLGCVPSQRTLFGGLERECAKELNQASQVLNDKLSRELGYLNNNLPNAKVVYIDIYNPVLDIITNPKKYGNIPLLYNFKWFNFLFICLLFLNILNFRL